MAKKINTILLLGISVLLSYAAGCADSGRFAVAGKAGTLGLGGEFTAGVTSNVNARVGYNALDLDFKDKEIENVNYDIGVGLSSFSALADWYIFNGSFHLSGGAFLMDNKIDLKGRPTENVEIGDNTYTPADVGTLTGRVKIDDLAPYVGIGWGNPLTSSRRWGFTCDLGVAFTSSPDVKLSASNPKVIQSDLEQERKKIEDDLDAIKFYPVISLGLYYRF
jgi:hypothetical protein